MPQFSFIYFINRCSSQLEIITYRVYAHKNNIENLTARKVESALRDMQLSLIFHSDDDQLESTAIRQELH